MKQCVVCNGINRVDNMSYCISERKPMYYDRNGKLMSLTDWMKSFGDFDSRVVKQETINGKFISTVWLGLEHGKDEKGDPLIYETMIFNKDGESERCIRCSNKEQARVIHEIAVEAVKNEHIV